jgi:hypothetical protein
MGARLSGALTPLVTLLVCFCFSQLLSSNIWIFDFYFGVLHPVAHTLARLLEGMSLATTLQGVYFIIYIFLLLHVLTLAYLNLCKFPLWSTDSFNKHNLISHAQVQWTLSCPGSSYMLLSSYKG